MATTKKNTDPQLQARDDANVNRMMLVFVIAVAAVVALLMIGNGGAAERTFVHSVLPILQIVSAVLFAASAVWFGICRAKKKDEGTRVVTSSLVFIVTLTLLLSSLLYTFIGGTMVIAVVIAVTVISFVYYFYPRDFYALSLVTAIMAASVIGAKASAVSAVWRLIVAIAFKVLAFAVPAAVIVVFLILKKNNGTIRVGGKTRTPFKTGYHAYPFYITAAIALAGAVLAIVLPSFAVYAVFAILAAYLVFAIIYTVRMM